MWSRSFRRQFSQPVTLLVLTNKTVQENTQSKRRKVWQSRQHALEAMAGIRTPDLMITCSAVYHKATSEPDSGLQVLMTTKQFNPLTPTVAIWVQHPVSDRVKPSSVIFDIRTLWSLGLRIRVPGCQNYKCCLTRSGTGCSVAVPVWLQWASKG